jgi:outer membrane receptor protein involved in Fe transport
MNYKQERIKTMKTKALFLSVLIILTTTTAFAATTGKIIGKVKDGESNDALPGVNLVLSGTIIGAATDSKGQYFIINIPPGIYSLEATMMGYKKVTVANIQVNMDRSTTVDIDMEPIVLVGSEVSVVAERDIVALDVSSSQQNISGSAVIEVPAIKNIEEFLNMQAGIENMLIRGGALNQTGMMIDGGVMVDELKNEPAFSSINLSTIEEISLLTGGFNAEYGNIRSGMINIVTKEGNTQKFHGSLDYRFSPGAKKHFGPSFYGADNYFLRAFMDPAVAFVGTENGTWDEITKRQNRSFEGWNSYAESKGEGRTPQECLELFKFQHFAEGSSREKRDDDKADHFLDGSFGGPVPLIGSYLGNMSFFASYRLEKNVFPYPMSRDHYWEDNTTLKITSNITNSMKLMLTSGYTEILSVMNGNSGTFYDDPNGILAVGNSYSYGSTIYANARFSTLDLYRNTQGLRFQHVLSPATFYEVRLDRMKTIYKGQNIAPRDTSRIYQFGPTFVDEAPNGYWTNSDITQDGMRIGMHFGTERDFSEIETINFRADFTSQINSSNQIKAGIQATYNDIDLLRISINESIPSSYSENNFRKFPIRLSGYVQDKLEIEGMIANLGVRVDHADPHTEWYSVDRYSPYFGAKYEDDFELVIPKENAKSQLRVSPRVGVSHPMTENAKIYFNYGHFYSIPRTVDYYGFQRSFPGNVTYLGNPSADLERTIAYELGYDHNLFDVLLVHLAGYYKDVTDQARSVSYTNYDGSVSYTTRENNEYADIRGFELRMEKTYGSWITGWANYNYMITTSGRIGRVAYYEDPIENRREGEANPYQSRPIAQPSFRANVTLMTPQKWGPQIAGINPLSGFHLGVFFNWRAGSWFTWNPNNDPTIVDNVQWADFSNWNARILKSVQTNHFSFELFMDIQNLFNQKIFNGQAGFADNSDWEDYMDSLKLPKSNGYNNEVGKDRVGGKEADYINMPNIESLTYRVPRDIFFGIRVYF